MRIRYKHDGIIRVAEIDKVEEYYLNAEKLSFKIGYSIFVINVPDVKQATKELLMTGYLDLVNYHTKIVSS